MQVCLKDVVQDLPQIGFIVYDENAQRPAGTAAVRTVGIKFGFRGLFDDLAVIRAGDGITLRGGTVKFPHVGDNLGDLFGRPVDPFQALARDIGQIRQGIEQEFGIGGNRGEGIVDVVCDISRHLAKGLETLAFGGGLLVTAQSILRDTFPPKQLGISQGIFALGAVMGPALGPPLGGFLVDNASWNWCFDINIGPGIAAGLLMLFLLKDPESARAMPIDLVGLGLLAAGLGSMQYILTEGEPNYWFADKTIDVMAAICVASLIGFVFYELFGTKDPVVDLRVLKNRSVSAGSVLSFALGAALLGSTYTLPQLTQGLLGFTPTLSGELFIIRAVPILLCTIPIVRLATKIDTRVLVGLGFVTLGVANAIQGFVTTSQASFWTFGLALALSGMGLAVLFIPLTIAVLAGTAPSQSAKASAFMNLSLQLGGSVSVAALSVFIDQRESFHTTVLGGQATLHSPAVQQFLGRGGSVGQLSQLVLQQATVRKPKAKVDPAHVEIGG